MEEAEAGEDGRIGVMEGEVEAGKRGLIVATHYRRSDDTRLYSISCSLAID